MNKVEEIRANVNPSNVSISYAPMSTCTWPEFALVTSEDVMTILKRMKPSSCLFDVMPTSLLFKEADIVAPHIVKLVNMSLSTGSVPSFLKQAAISPVLKNPNLDPTEPSNYRPISKLPFLSKVMEKVVAEQLTAFVSNKDLLDKFQSGFCKMHCTETALLKVSGDIQMAADTGLFSILILLICLQRLTQ